MVAAIMELAHHNTIVDLSHIVFALAYWRSAPYVGDFSGGKARNVAESGCDFVRLPSIFFSVLIRCVWLKIRWIIAQ